MTQRIVQVPNLTFRRRLVDLACVSLTAAESDEVALDWMRAVDAISQ
jgi:hypothetical protein